MKKFVLVPLIFALGAFLGCSHGTMSKTSKKPMLEVFTLENPPEWGKTLSGDSVFAGGFSGLLFLGLTDKGEFQFMTHTDRGPNGEPLYISGVGKNVRPFLLPDFQPRWVKLETNSKNKTLRIVDEILLKDPKGNPLSGKPQWPATKVSGADEKGVDLKGTPLEADFMGIDPEGLTRDDQGFYWMCEEYRPSLLKFNSQGQLLKRYIPRNSLPQDVLKRIHQKWGSQVVQAVLPEDYKLRKSNRGFEGLTFKNGKIFAILQSPLEIPNSEHKKIIRLVEFDPNSETVTAEYSYPLNEEGVDKMGDLSVLPNSTSFLAIEQNSKTGAAGIHNIQAFHLEEKANGPLPEKTPWDQLQTKAGLLKLKKLVGLTETGYDFAEKVEGLAVISDTQIAVLNDNDFGVNGDFDLGAQKVPLTQNRKSKLGVIRWEQ